MSNNRRNFCMVGVVLLGLAISEPPVAAQLIVKDLIHGVTAQQLVDRLLGGGVSAFNVTYTGSNNAAAKFCGGTGIVGFENGIVLSSGSALNILGPNDSASAGTDNGLPGDAALDSLIPGYQTFDACILEFDFIPQGSQVQFNYVFGSEEYNEFVGSTFNDVFGFFVNGVNRALLPGTITPVAINTVNNGHQSATSGLATGPCVNCTFFIDNTGSLRNTQLDGLTTVLPMVAPVIAGAVNHMKIAVADAGDNALDSAVFLQAGSLKSFAGSTNLITRSARFWFTHGETNDSTCTTLKQALVQSQNVGCDVIDLGFLSVPTFPRYGNVTDPPELGLIETLGLYYRSSGLTGEPVGTQGKHLSASVLCTARKKLAIEFIAATANSLLLGADPSWVTYVSGRIVTNFPADLLSQARAVAAGPDLVQVKTMTALLQKFNSSGVTNDLPAGLVECSPNKTAALRNLSRDPTTQSTCPGLNGSCGSAKAIAGMPFQDSVNLNQLSVDQSTNVVFSTSCGSSSYSAVWALSPPVAAISRSFTVSTFGSNFGTLLSVWSGSCDHLVPVVCSANTEKFGWSQLSFISNGTNTYYIVGQGANSASGKLKIRVTSP